MGRSDETATSTAQADLTLASDAVLDLAFAEDQTLSTLWERRDLRPDGDAATSRSPYAPRATPGRS